MMGHFRKCVHRVCPLISAIVLVLSGSCWGENGSGFGNSGGAVDPLGAIPGNASTDAQHANRRFKVASWDFLRVGPPFMVATALLLASLAKIVFHLRNVLSSVFPESCLLILLGVGLGVSLRLAGFTGYQLHSDIFFLYLLPPIILDAGYFMPNRAFFDNIGTILLLAVVGTLLNTLLLGLSVWLLTFTVHVQLLHCLTLSALLSAVDPVAVLAVFEQTHINEVLHIVVFGESLLNVAVSVVLYHMFGAYSEIGSAHIQALDVLAGLLSFILVLLCGMVIGIIFGLLTALMSRFTNHVRIIQPLLVFVMGYLSYLTAEIFHFSGILACTFCAITMKQYVEANISAKSHTTIKYFLKMLASACETIIFMLLGVSTVLDNHHWNTLFIISTLIFCITYRAVGVLGLSYLANRFRLVPLTRNDQFIMGYGGLRGAFAFALASLLDENIFREKRLFLTTTVFVIYFTIFVQGTTIKPLAYLLYGKRSNKTKPGMNEQINTRMMDHFMAGIEDVIGQHGHHELRARFDYINGAYLKPLLVRQKATKHRGLSVLNVFQKLHEKDVKDCMDHNSSVLLCSQPYVSTATSLAGLFIHRSAASSVCSDGYSEEDTTSREPGIPLPMPDNDSSTCLDMQVLEAQYSRKMKDDGKIHHIIEDAMFMPRQRFTRHRRHMLPESNKDPPFHHKARLHLRHLVSHSQPQMNGHVRGPPNGFDLKPRKNVSFADTPYEETDDEAADAGSAIAEASVDVSDSDSDTGIVFTAQQTDELSQPVVPTAVESSLPWKRCTDQEDPVCFFQIHCLPADDQPQLGEVPSWVNTEEYTTPAVASQAMVERQQSKNSSACSSHGGCTQGNSTQQQQQVLPLCNGAPEPAGSGCSEVILPPPWQTAAAEKAVSNDQPQWSSHPKLTDNNRGVDNGNGDENGNKSDTADFLPPPWHCQPDSNDVLPPPWQNMVDTSDLLPPPCQNEADTTDLLPPPWQNEADTTDLLPPPWHNEAEQLPSPSQNEPNTSDLPPPWHKEPCTADWNKETDSTDNHCSDEHTPLVRGDAPKLPWLCNIGQDEADVSYRTKCLYGPTPSCPVFHSPTEVEEDPVECIPPPPWRRNSNVDVSLDQQAPRPALSQRQDSYPPRHGPCKRQDSSSIIPPWHNRNGSTGDTDPMYSPSVSHDAFSLRPQPSTHSFRFSEAESRHSEHPVMHHHMIDLCHHTNHSGVEEAVLPPEADDDDDGVDLYDRVSKWLAASEPHIYDPVPTESDLLLPQDHAACQSSGSDS